MCSFGVTVSADLFALGGEELKALTVTAIRHAFEAAGIVFISENGGGVGVRLRKRRGKR